jgi:uncharacterized membrane protein
MTWFQKLWWWLTPKVMDTYFQKYPGAAIAVLIRSENFLKQEGFTPADIEEGRKLLEKDK